MADWAKKINKSVGGSIPAGETVTVGMILQPAGQMKGMMAKSLGGLVGAAIVAKLGKGDDATLITDSGIAATIPDDTVILGLTQQHVLFFSWAKLTGKPKELKATLPRSSISAIEIEKKTANHAVVVLFSDGTGRIWEAPKVGNDTEEFVAAFRQG